MLSLSFEKISRITKLCCSVNLPFFYKYSTHTCTRTNSHTHTRTHIHVHQQAHTHKLTHTHTHDTHTHTHTQALLTSTPYIPSGALSLPQPQLSLHTHASHQPHARGQPPPVHGPIAMPRFPPAAFMVQPFCQTDRVEVAPGVAPVVTGVCIFGGGGGGGFGSIRMIE